MEVAIPYADITFDASASTITVDRYYSNLTREQVLKIQNLTTGDTIYDFHNPNKYNISVLNGVITHTYDNPEQEDTDIIQVILSLNEAISKNHVFKLVDEGRMFRNFHKFDLLDEGIGNILIKTGAKYTKVFLDAQGNGDCLVEIYKDTTVSADGTPMSAGNFNFNSSNTPVTTWFTGPTITADGTYIAQTYILGGSGVVTPSATKAAASMEGLDVILEPNTNYLIRFTNEAERTIKALFEVDFREDTYDSSN